MKKIILSIFTSFLCINLIPNLTNQVQAAYMPPKATPQSTVGWDTTIYDFCGTKGTYANVDITYPSGETGNLTVTSDDLAETARPGTSVTSDPSTWANETTEMSASEVFKHIFIKTNWVGIAENDKANGNWHFGTHLNLFHSTTTFITGFCASNGKDGESRYVTVYPANTKGSFKDSIFEKFYFTYYIKLTASSARNWSKSVFSYGGGGGKAGCQEGTRADAPSSTSPCSASFACLFCKSGGTANPCINARAASGRAGFVSSGASPKEGYTPGEGIYNYEFSWKMPIASEFLTYGEAGEPGEYVTKKVSPNGVIKVLPGKAGTWTSSNEDAGKSGKKGPNGKDTEVQGENLKILARGGIGGKGGLKTKRYNLCQKNLEENVEGCSDKNTQNDIPTSTPKDSFFKSISALTNNSDLTKNNIAGSGGTGGGSESKNNFVCGHREVINLHPHGDNTLVNQTTTNCNHTRTYLSNNKINGKTGAVIITW